jgi:predicted aspartyl protease
MQGVVNARLEAILPVRLRGPTGIELLCDAIIDTGSTFSLTMTPSIVATLGLAPSSSADAMMANGVIRKYDIYSVEIEWDGVWQAILAPAVGTEVLLGIRLIAGHELKIVAKPGGTVEIKRLP